MVGMDSKLRRHFQHLSDTFGHSTCEDLKELGKDKVATDLHAAVAACTLQQYSAALVRRFIMHIFCVAGVSKVGFDYTAGHPQVFASRPCSHKSALQAPAHAVVQAAWEVLQETGWDHPAWREAYSLAQLCLAAAYTLPELTTTASACTQPIPTSSDSAPNSPGSKAPTSEPGQPHAAAPSGRPRSSAIHSSPPALGHSQLPQNNAQTKSPPEIAKPDSHRQGSMKQDSLACSCLKKDSSDPASPRKSSSKQVIPELDSHIMKAMQALDLASILGAPPEMLAPLLSTTEPLAKQAHQASLAQQNRLPLQQRHCTPPADPSSHQQRDSMHKRQTSSAQHTRCQAYRGDQGTPGWLDQSSLMSLRCLLNRVDTAWA